MDPVYTPVCDVMHDGLISMTLLLLSVRQHVNAPHCIQLESAHTETVLDNIYTSMNNACLTIVLHMFIFTSFQVYVQSYKYY